MKRQLIKISVLAALLIWAPLMIATLSRAQEKKTQRHSWNWINSDDGKRIEVKVENKVEFNEDYSDVTSVADGGELFIYDSRGARKYRLIITGGSTGELKRDYSVDGQTRQFDAEGREWLRKVLLQAVREGGLDARNRVQRIMKVRGVRGLIDELAYIKGDYVRRIYFEALLQAPGVGNQDLKTALQNASNSIQSDYERAQLLMQVATVFLNNRELLTDYLTAASKIDSDYEKNRVLSAALNRAELNRDALIIIAQTAAKIGSDYEKASFLIKAASRFQSDAALRSAWLKAVSTIDSDYEHRRALKGALKTTGLSVEALAGLVESAASMQSDYEKASFLLEAMNYYRADARLRSTFVNTAKTIGSEYERGRVQKRFDSADF